METYIWVILLVVALVFGFGLGFALRIIINEKGLKQSQKTKDKIVEDGKKEAEDLKKTAILEAKQEIFELRQAADADLRERRSVVVTLENKSTQREEALNNRTQYLDRREETILEKESRLEERKTNIEQLNSKAEELVKQQDAKLTEVAGLSRDTAKQIIMEEVKDKTAVEVMTYIKEQEEIAKNEAHNKSKEILASAMNKYAQEVTTERTVSVIGIPNDEMKGRIIGREGRNIRAIEALTGVDLIIDDTPEAIVLSGFDPVRREIAKRALTTLVADGRIHPSRIEEVVERTRQEVDIFIREAGEEAVFRAGVGRVHPDLIKLLGKLQFRTSYGQNVLQHSLEVAFLAGKMAAEIGENEVIAKRAGLLHDIGKAVDHDVEGSHVDIGVNLVSRYKEPKEVVDAIASHHGDQEAQSIIAVLVAAADALSAARPGARSEQIDNYVQRLQQLETISNSVSGVEKAYAVQAGREVRVMVFPEQVDDVSTFSVARQIKEAIEAQMSYPGTIKITVIRETRATDTAK